LLHIKVINLGESYLRALGIPELNDFTTLKKEDDIFLDNFTLGGVSFDGKQWHACKTPLGRKGYANKPDFELILTPNEMIKFQTNLSWFESDSYLVQSLRNVCWIYGDYDLLNDYNILLQKHLFQEEMISILKSDIIKWNITHKIEKITFANVKFTIYRQIERIIAALGNIHNIVLPKNKIVNTLWDILERLSIDEQLKKNMEYCLNFATRLRISTYFEDYEMNEKIQYYQQTIFDIRQLITIMFP
jgi:hypothetical protein